MNEWSYMRNHDLLDWKRVERVLIAGWWYNVVPGSFRGTIIDGADHAEYMFDYYPNRRRAWDEPPKTMFTSNEKIEAIQLSGSSQ